MSIHSTMRRGGKNQDQWREKNVQNQDINGYENHHHLSDVELRTLAR